jgi:hypothetical protein
MMTRSTALLAAVIFLCSSCTTQNPAKKDQGTRQDVAVKEQGPQPQDRGPLPPDQYVPPPDYTPPPPDQYVPQPDRYVPPTDRGVTPVPDKGTPIPDLGGPGPDQGIVNGTCTGAEKLTWSGGKITKTGTTAGAPNEYGSSINCGNLTTPIPGPQVYYKVDLTGGTSYKLSLEPTFDSARIYVFSACGASAINKDCSGKGAGGASPAINSPSVGSMVFKPPKTATYYVAVDSNQPAESGSFTLTIEPYTPPTNTTCSAAKLLTMTSGTLTVLGSTRGVANEFGRTIRCGSSGTDYDGAQVYYRLAMTAGHIYRIDLIPNFRANMYIFRTTCTATAINADCGSGGKTGAVYSSLISPGSSGRIDFKPATSGTYTIAVDSYVATEAGDFKLKIEDFVAPTNTTCATAKAVSFSGGRITINGTNSGAPNEFGSSILCGYSASYAQDGNQVYYKMTLTTGRVYKFSLTPTYIGSMYLFGTTCTATAINNDCGSGGTTGAVNYLIQRNTTGTMVFKPSATRTYTLAVDSIYYTPSYGEGKFKLEIEETPIPVHANCSTPQALYFVKGVATVNGDTSVSSNEFGTSIRCNASASYAQDGPQLYYWANLAKGKTYRFSLSPTFTAYIYVFGNSCSVSTINSDCGSNYVRGFATYATSGTTRTVLYTPSVGGIHRIAVDSTSPSYAGKFTLEVADLVLPGNGRCAAAQAVTLNPSGTTTITGDTTGVPNEYGSAIRCGGFVSYYGPQLYYKFQLAAGKTYSFTLKPTFSYAGFYIFGSTCSSTSINTDCASRGKTGDNSNAASPTSPASVSFSPTTSGVYHVAVDSIYGTRWGKFTLEVK